MALLSQQVNANTPISKSLGFNPRGVVVDNVSAYWLYFPQADKYCPPFTARWSAPLVLNSNGYGYMEIKTPFGQTIQTNIPTGLSQFVAIQWTDQPLPYDPGQSVDPTTAVSGNVYETQYVWRSLLAIPSAPRTDTLIPAPGNGKRIRLLTINTSLAQVYTGGSTPTGNVGDSPIYYQIYPTTLTPLAVGRLSGNQPNVSHLFPLGFNMLVNQELDITYWSYFADNFYDIEVSYQVMQV